MKLLTTVILLLIFCCTAVYPQSYTFQFSFGKFKNAASFYINSAGMIYVTDAGSDEIFKFDTLGTMVKEAGGYGWKDNNFDDPADIFASPLNIYVSDKNNHRIVRYDKDLNFISSLYKRESDNHDEQFGYPLSCAASSQGDLYILDSENKRILKFDLFGNFIQNFGGIDAGDYSLSAPVKLTISPTGYIYVLDSGRLIIFDQYGNGAAVQQIEKDIVNVNIIFSQLTMNSASRIFSTTLNSSENTLHEIKLNNLPEQAEFQATLIFGDKLFVLTQKNILVFVKSSL